MFGTFTVNILLSLVIVYVYKIQMYPLIYHENQYELFWDYIWLYRERKTNIL